MSPSMPYIKFSSHEIIKIDSRTPEGRASIDLLRSKGFKCHDSIIEGVVVLHMPDIKRWSAKERNEYKLKYPDLA